MSLRFDRKGSVRVRQNKRDKESLTRSWSFRQCQFASDYLNLMDSSSVQEGQPTSSTVSVPRIGQNDQNSRGNLPEREISPLAVPKESKESLNCSSETFANLNLVNLSDDSDPFLGIMRNNLGLNSSGFSRLSTVSSRSSIASNDSSIYSSVASGYGFEFQDMDARPAQDPFRFSQATLEDTQEDELNAILGELSALQLSLDIEIKNPSQNNSQSPSQQQRTENSSTTTTSPINLSQNGLQRLHVPSNGGEVVGGKSNGGSNSSNSSSGSSSDNGAPRTDRTDSPDDSGFSDNASLLSSGSSLSTAGSSSSGGSTTSNGPKNLQPSNIIHANELVDLVHLKLQNENSLINDEKAEKIRIALEKMRQASVTRLYVKAFSPDGSSKALMVEEGMSCGRVLALLAEKNHVPLSPKWALVEHLPHLHMERIYEDHENMVENLLMWTRDSQNKIFFMEREEEKYDMFTNPQKYFMQTSRVLGTPNFMDEHTKNGLIDEFFAHGVGVPEVESVLYLKAEGKKAWKKFPFVLRASGIYYYPKGKVHANSSKDLVCLATIDENQQAYQGIGWKKKFKSPTEFGFVLKPSRLQVKSHRHMKYLCCEDQQTLRHWLVGLRIAKYGKQLWENYRSLMEDLAQEDLDRFGRSVSLASMPMPVQSSNSQKSHPPEPPMKPKQYPVSNDYNQIVVVPNQDNSNSNQHSVTNQSHSSSESTVSSNSGGGGGGFGFESDSPVGGTIKRKPSNGASTVKIPLTINTRSIVGDFIQMNQHETGQQQQPQNSNLNTFQRKRSGSGSSTSSSNSQVSINMMNNNNNNTNMTMTMTMGQSNHNHMPGAQSIYGTTGSGLQRNSLSGKLPPNPRRSSQLSLNQIPISEEVIAENEFDFENLPPPPPELLMSDSMNSSTLSEHLLLQNGEIFQNDFSTKNPSNCPAPPPPPPPECKPYSPNPIIVNKSNSSLPRPTSGVKKGVSFATELSERLKNRNSNSPASSPCTNTNAIVNQQQQQQQPSQQKMDQTPQFVHLQSTQPSPKKLEEPPVEFLQDLQRVMEKKWQVSQKCHMDKSKTPADILGFRVDSQNTDSTDGQPEPEKLKNVNAWVNQHYGSSLDVPPPLQNDPQVPSSQFQQQQQHQQQQQFQQQQNQMSQIGSPIVPMPPPQPLIQPQIYQAPQIYQIPSQNIQNIPHLNQQQQMSNSLPRNQPPVHPLLNLRDSNQVHSLPRLNGHLPPPPAPPQRESTTSLSHLPVQQHQQHHRSFPQQQQHQQIHMNNSMNCNGIPPGPLGRSIIYENFSGRNSHSLNLKGQSQSPPNSNNSSLRSKKPPPPLPKRAESTHLSANIVFN